MKPPRLKTRVPRKLRILVIGAHPADIFDQSGGTMAHHTKRGDWVGCVVLTHGARVHDEVISDQMFRRKQVPEASKLRSLMSQRSDVKANEVRKACAILGVKDLYFLGEDDAYLQATKENVRKIATLIRALKPNILLTHFPKEGGGVASPHSVTGEITMAGAFLAAAVDPGDRNPPHRIAQVFFWGMGAAAVRAHVWGAEGGFTNDTFVDITDVVRNKLAALDCLKSQGYGGAYARKRIENSDGAFGSEAKVPYAEGFITWKSATHHYLPVTEIDLKVSMEPDHDMMTRMSYMHRDAK